MSGILSTTANELRLRRHLSHHDPDLATNVKRNLVHYPLAFNQEGKYGRRDARCRCLQCDMQGARDMRPCLY